MRRQSKSAIPPDITPTDHSSSHMVGAGELFALIGFCHQWNGEMAESPDLRSLQRASRDLYRGDQPWINRLVKPGQLTTCLTEAAEGRRC